MCEAWTTIYVLKSVLTHQELRVRYSYPQSEKIWPLTMSRNNCFSCNFFTLCEVMPLLPANMPALIAQKPNVEIEFFLVIQPPDLPVGKVSRVWEKNILVTNTLKAFTIITVHVSFSNTKFAVCMSEWKCPGHPPTLYMCFRGWKLSSVKTFA